MVEVFLWGRNDYSKFQARALRAVIVSDHDILRQLERMLLLSLPSWIES